METLIDSPRAGLRLRPVVLGLLALVVLAIALGRPPDALAALGSVNVTVEGRGSVTGDGINCPASDCSDQAAWREDQAAPRVTLTAALPLPGHRLEWSGCTVSGGRPRECTATYSEEGTAVTARFVDTVAPQVALDGLEEGQLFGPASPPVALRATASDDVGVARVEFYDGAGLFATDFSAPWAADRTLPARADGPFALRATAFDAAGNATSATRNGVYDGTAPAVTVEGDEERWAGTSATWERIVWSSSDAHPGTERCTVQAPGATTATVMPCAHPLRVMLPDDGRWTVTVGATDAVGNARQRTIVINADRVAPAALQVIDGLAAGSVWPLRVARFVLAAPGEAGPLTWTCWVEQGGRRENLSCPNGVANWSTVQGSVEFGALVTDRAGNASPVLLRRFTVDWEQPTVELTAGPADGSEVAAGAVAFAWTATDATPIDRTVCRWDEGELLPCPDGRTARTLAPGPHRFQLRVTDSGNNTQVVERSFVVRAAVPPPGGGDPGGGNGGPSGGGGEPSGPAGGGPSGSPPPAGGPSGGGSPGGGSPSGGGTPGGGTPSTKRCVVPRIKAGGSPKQVQRLLTRAGCRVKTRQVRSAKIRRGRVVGLSRKAGTTLRHQTTIVVSVSRGR